MIKPRFKMKYAIEDPRSLRLAKTWIHSSIQHIGFNIGSTHMTVCLDPGCFVFHYIDELAEIMNRMDPNILDTVEYHFDKLEPVNPELLEDTEDDVELYEVVDNFGYNLKSIEKYLVKSEDIRILFEIGKDKITYLDTGETFDISEFFTDNLDADASNILKSLANYEFKVKDKHLRYVRSVLNTAMVFRRGCTRVHFYTKDNPIGHFDYPNENPWTEVISLEFLDDIIHKVKDANLERFEIIPRFETGFGFESLEIDVKFY